MTGNFGDTHVMWSKIFDEQAGAELGQAQPQLGLRLTNVEI